MEFLVKFFTNYAKQTASWRMLIHALLFIMVVTWVGLVGLIASNFTTIADMINRYQSIQNVTVENALTVSKNVNRLLQDQRIRLGVDRIYVSKFHNGKVDVNGIHFIYFSRISESDGPGISNEMARSQNLPLSIFPDMLHPISQGSCYYVSVVDQTVPNASFLMDMGVGSMIVCPIHSVNGKLIGVIGVDGVRQQINTGNAPEIQESLETLSGVLGGLLSTK